MIYTAETVALAALELRVHLDLPPDLIPLDYALIAIELPDAAMERLDDIPVDAAASGDEWLDSNRSAALRVPSFVVPESWNVLLNPEHPDARLITISEVRPFAFDSRLWLPLKP